MADPARRPRRHGLAGPAAVRLSAALHRRRDGRGEVALLTNVAATLHAGEGGPYRVFAYGSLASTNDEAMARLRAGDPGGCVVTAASQTGGRGRHGRAWSSPVGNLYASLALRDPASVALAPQLGFVAGVALARTLRARLGGDPRLRLKWPNDALFAGAKLAGILLESAALPDGLGCVIGFGVNCASHPPGLVYPATDLRAAGAGDVEPLALLEELARAIDVELLRWNKGAGFAEIRAAWLDLAAGLGAPIVVTTGRRTLQGIFRDLDATGRLMIETAGELMAVDAGDVFLSVPATERAT